MLKLPASRLSELFSRIAGERKLYLPVLSNGVPEFNEWTPAATLALYRLNTVKSPKDFFFPQSEDIVTFKTNKKEISIEENRNPAEAFAIFGVRSCDAESLKILDRVFLNDPIDTFYQSRRQNGVIITSACFEPEETCFCGTFKIDPLSTGGDIATWLLQDTLYWKSLTERGNELTDKVKGLFENAGKSDEELIASAQAKTKELLAKLPFHDLCLEKYSSEQLLDLFNSSLWGNLNPTCLSCGTCTFICPTCHCYDIQDFNTGNEIQRFRCWDSCMYSDFTLMAHGNPRPNQLQRFRQRYMHKLVYYPEKNEGVTACVGCGRCVVKCPISMNIVKVIKALGTSGNDVKGGI